MPRYHDPYADIDVSRFREKPPTAQDKKTEKDADFWRFIGDIAPAAGTAAGAGLGALGFLAGPEVGVPAMAAGGAIGTGIGNAVGAGAKSHAESEVADLQDREQNRQMRQDALLSVLMNLR